MSSLVQ